jgi:hypothetical protein
MEEKLFQINPINETVLRYYTIMRNKDFKSSFMIFVHGVMNFKKCICQIRNFNQTESQIFRRLLR